MALTKEQRGEVADGMVIFLLTKKGIHLDPEELREKLPEVARAIGIAQSVLLEYAREVVKKVSQDIFTELQESFEKPQSTHD